MNRETTLSPQVSNGRLYFWSITAALSGFLFGFDTVVISGAEQTIQDLWQLSPSAHGLAMSMALWGTVVGSLIGGWPTDRFGRKKTLIFIGIFYLVSAVWSAMATDAISFMIARFIGGLGVGVSTVAAPLFISEIAPPDRRGRLTGMFQFNIVAGILIAFVSNWIVSQWGENAWRWMLGIEAVPALIYSLMCLGLPESPRWLIGRKKDVDRAAAVLRLIDPGASDSDIVRQTDEIAAASQSTSSTSGFWTARLKTPILLAFLVAFFNQLSGINAILYFAPRIFELTGLGQQAALLQSVGIGVTNLIFTFVGLWLIDRLGRKTLLYIGSLGYIASLGLCAASFLYFAPQFKVATAASSLVKSAEKAQLSSGDLSAQETLDEAKLQLATASADPAYLGEPVNLENVPADQVATVAQSALEAASEHTGMGSKLILCCIFAFIAAHAVGQGAVIWVFISEIFPNLQRAQGQAFGSGTHWVFAALLTLLFPIAITKFAPGPVFLFFCLMMVLQLVWVWWMVPETKGRPLEDIERELGIGT